MRLIATGVGTRSPVLHAAGFWYVVSSWGLRRKLEQLLGYTFKDRNLLQEACTHASWRDSTTPCYQRLEFLGDAILDVLITQTLAERHK